MNKAILSASVFTALLALPVASADDVTCRSTLGARAVDGTVVVPAGATCTLNGTRVDGDVKVARGGTLIVRNARIGGNIQSEGFRSVRVEGGSVGGNVQLKEGGAPTLGGVRVDGDIQLEKNRARAVVRSNVVGGNLQCQGNTSSPTGSGNRVEGDKEDQCRTL